MLKAPKAIQGQQARQRASGDERSLPKSQQLGSAPAQRKPTVLRWALGSSPRGGALGSSGGDTLLTSSLGGKGPWKNQVERKRDKATTCQ